MSEESSGSGLKNAIIGLVTIIVTAVAGVVGKNLMGGDEAPAAAAVAAPAPIINLNVENNNSVKGGGGSDGTSTPAAKPAPKKDDWTKAEPKW
jgi:hypothetical protein